MVHPAATLARKHSTAYGAPFRTLHRGLGITIHKPHLEAVNITVQRNRKHLASHGGITARPDLIQQKPDPPMHRSCMYANMVGALPRVQCSPWEPSYDMLLETLDVVLVLLCKSIASSFAIHT